MPQYPPLRLLWFFPDEAVKLFQGPPSKGRPLESHWEPTPVDLIHDTDHEVYKRVVDALRFHSAFADLNPTNPQYLAEMDSYLPLAAYMQQEGLFSDKDIAPALFRYHPSTDLAHTMRTMPDICRVVFDLKFWTKDCPSDWATLLTKATPLPCKGRNLEKSFAEAIELSPNVFDFVLRVLFGCFLGLYGGRVAGFQSRLALYAAFVTYPPSVKDLQRFLLANKAVTGLCIESYILFSMRQGALDIFLRKTYQWEIIWENRMAAMRCLQDCVDHLIDTYGFEFMTIRAQHAGPLGPEGELLLLLEKQKERPGLPGRGGQAAPLPPNWDGVGPKLKEFSVAFKKYCFRPVTQSLTSCVMGQAFKIWRKESDTKCYTGLLKLPTSFLQHIWSIPYEPTNQTYFDGALTLLPPKFFSEDIRKKWTKLRHDYYMESTMTGAQHLMAGTEKKKTGLYFTDKNAFFDIFGFCIAVENRRKIRWSTLPREWALNQAEALRLPGTNGISPHAGVYFICPNCCTVCCMPVTFPEGVQRDKRERARYSHNTRIDLGTMEITCKAYSQRRKEQIIKRRKRKNKDCDNIRVCSDTKLVRFCMIGMVLWTEHNGNLVLCVDCGTMVSWTPECYTDRGPTCGCALQEPPPPPLGSCVYCKREFSSRTKYRTHLVLNELTGDMEEMRVCTRHGTAWEHKLPYVFTREQILTSIERWQYAFLLHGTSPIFVDKNR